MFKRWCLVISARHLGLGWRSPATLLLAKKLSMGITLGDVKAVGAFGRLTLAGKEGDVEEAAAAAMRAIEIVNRSSAMR